MHQRLTAKAERGAERYGEDLVEHGIGGGVDRTEVERSSVVDQQVEPPEFGNDGIDDGLGRIIGGDVGGKEFEGHGGAQRILQRLQLARIAPGAEHAVAIRAQLADNRLANAARRAGDDCCLA